MTASVIVPVYNAERFLRRCVESVLGQTFGDLQLILVDDGSCDGSGPMCDTFAGKDPRVLAVHRVNGGAAAARNAGLDAARGEYVVFVDADDYLEPAALETLIGALTTHGVEMAVGSHYGVRIGRDNTVVTRTAIPIRNCGVKPRDQWLQIRYDDQAPCSKDEVSRVWGKVFLGQRIRENRLRFREELFWLEDITFCLEYAATIKQAVSVPDLLWNYCHFGGDVHTSLTRKVFPNEYENINRAYAILREVFSDRDIGGEARRCLDGFYARNVIGCFIRMFSARSPFVYEQAVTKARAICAEPLVKETLASYRAVAGCSRMIPFLMRCGMVRAAARVARMRG